MLTNRLKPHLTTVIGTQQTGYVPGRFIGFNISKLIDLLNYLECENISAILMNVDFEKCFDSIEHNALLESLRFFNIGEYFISWVKMLYCNFEFCILNNGKHSSYTPQHRGVHQGSALSGPLFIYTAEILALMVKNNPKIKGICIEQNDEKISQYADDANFWSIYEAESINSIIQELEEFRKNTGLKANYEKSVIQKIGSAKGKKRLNLSKRFRWEDSTISTLGMIIEIDELQNIEVINYADLITKVKNVMNVKNVKEVEGKEGEVPTQVVWHTCKCKTKVDKTKPCIIFMY